MKRVVDVNMPLEEFLEKYAGNGFKFKGVEAAPLSLLLEVGGRVYRVRLS